MRSDVVAVTGIRGELGTTDPRGTLQLEGQVIDADGAPVAGANVTIDTASARTIENAVNETVDSLFPPL